MLTDRETPDLACAAHVLRLVELAALTCDLPGDDLDAAPAALSAGMSCAGCCGKTCEVPELYCGPYCRDAANTVRYARKALVERRRDDPDFRLGFGTKLLSLFQGGYPRGRRLSQALRETVLERDGWRCQLCGEPATEVDHIQGDSPDPMNLRAACGPCNRARVWTVDGVVTDEERAEAVAVAENISAEIALRIAANAPLHLCDDGERWEASWRGIKAARRKLLDGRWRGDSH
jgi:hypothetical protein